MSDYTQAQVQQAAAIVAMTDAALAERIAVLRAVTADDLLGDDNLSGAGWVELDALEAELAKRPPTCGLCGRAGVLSPGRTICPSCAYWPLD